MFVQGHPMLHCQQPHNFYMSGVAVSCQVKGNLIKFRLFSVLFNFVFQISHIKE